MVRNNNTDVTKQLREGLKIEQAIEQVPTEVASKIVPVYVANPQRICDIVRSTTGIAPTTVYTTPTDKDFFLTNVWASVGGINSAIGRIVTVTIDGQAQVVLNCAGTADQVDFIGNQSVSMNLPTPIKLDKGSAISVSGTSASGAAGIVGYIVEN